MAYKYKPLSSASSMRLARLSIGLKDGDLWPLVQLAEVDLNSPEKPQFDCLSYTWGNPMPMGSFREPSKQEEDVKWQERRRILMSDTTITEGLRAPSDAAFIEIGQNLSDFLKRIRSLGPGSWIWIDALCINQADVVEREAQVAMMGRIYSICFQVIVWLGVEGPDTRIAFRLMLEAESRDGDTAQSDSLSSERKQLTDHTASERIIYGRPVMDPSSRLQLSSKDWDLLSRFLSRGWFHRAWTLQECLLPARVKVMCGSYTVESEGLEKFQLLIRILQSHVEGKAEGKESTESGSDPSMSFSQQYRWLGFHLAGNAYVALPPKLSQLFFYNRILAQRCALSRDPAFEAGSFSMDFTTALTNVRGRACSIDHDLVYSIFGFLHTIPCSIDYSRSWQHLSIICARATDSALYYREDESSRKNPDLPTWCPDWTSPATPSPWIFQNGCNYHTGFEAIHAQPISNDPFSIDLQSQLLTLRAYQTETVTHVACNSKELYEGSGLLRCLSLMASVFLRTGPDLKSTGSPPERSSTTPNIPSIHRDIDAFWQTLLAGLPGEPNEKLQQDALGSSFKYVALFLLARDLAQSERFAVGEGPAAAGATTREIQHVIAAFEAAQSVRGHLPSWLEISSLAKTMRTLDTNRTLARQQHALFRVTWTGTDALRDSQGAIKAALVEIREVLERARPYASLLSRLFDCRRFFATSQGRIGIGHQSLRVGDAIHIFENWRYPFILRSPAEGRTRPTFVGCAYLRGIMHGELVMSGEARFEDLEIE